MFEVFEAITEEQKAELYRFRYEVNTKDMPLVEGLESAEVQELIASSQHLHIEQGAHLVGRGDMGPELFLILDGIAEVRGHVRDGQMGPVLNTFGRGDFFGEMSVLTGKPRSADIFAKTALEVIFIDQLTLRRFVKGKPALGAKLLFNMARVLADRLEQMSERWLSDQARIVATEVAGLPRKIEPNP
ncbi:MAG: cyclic nucleotide-binding domain-containing protein [Panacagrimonas sp.]